MTGFVSVGDDIMEKADSIINRKTWYACDLISVNDTWKDLEESAGKSFCEDFVVGGEKGYWSPV